MFIGSSGKYKEYSLENFLISVIVPVYNVEKYLRRCLDSIINQTYENLEIICVNDGSTDKSLFILEEYAARDSRINIISQENQGLSEARNRGLRCARGEYVSFIDSDDWIDGYYYESMVTKIYSDNVDIVFACMKSMNQNKIWINKNKNQVVDKFHEKVRLFRNGSVCDKLIKKRLFEENEISFIKGRYFEDNIVLLQLAFFSKKLATDDAVSYNYFFNPHSICRKSSEIEEEKRNKDKLFMAETIVDYFSRYNVSVREKKEIFFFLTRAFIANWLEVTSPFYSRMIKLFGKRFVFEYKMKSFCHRVFYGKLSKVRKMFKYIYLCMRGGV